MAAEEGSGGARRPRLLVLGAAERLPRDWLADLAELADVELAATPAEARAALPRAEALLVVEFPLAELPALWPLAGGVRWVHTLAAGVNRLLFPALRGSGVLVSNGRGAQDAAMAEHALALLLYFAHGLDRAGGLQRARRWEPAPLRPLEGRTLVVVGLGSIGGETARRAGALGMRVVGVRRGGAPHPAAERVYPAARLREALGLGEYVVVQVPLTDDTRGLIGGAELAAMRRGAVFVNLARGAVVDEQALLGALRRGHLRGAASDVFAQEPLPPDSPLWDAPHLLVTPHVAWATPGSRARLFAQALENARRFASGLPPLALVDTRRGY